MKTHQSAVREKEEAAKVKALRKELESKLQDQLPPEMLEEKLKVEVTKIATDEPIDADRAKQVVEALIFAATKPLTVPEIRKVLGGQFSAKEIEKWLSEIREVYAQQDRSFELIEIAGGYEFATRKDFAPWILKIELQKKARQATQSALETLAILAYKQPITRAEIEELRGVDVSGVLNTLLERGFIKIVGKKEIPGRPFLYGSTEKFLEHFGLKSIQDLPSLDDIKTIVENAVKKDELFGRQQMMDIPQEETPKVEESVPTENNEAAAAQENENGSSEPTQEN